MATTTNATDTDSATRTSRDPREYMFKRDFYSAMRQNINHFTMKGLTGWLMHPAICLPADAKIADIGCGTGIWVQEVADQLPPPARMHGFDISPAMFPAPSWRLGHVTLTVHDAFKPFPVGLQGTFDMVHVRFMRCFVGDDDVDRFVTNAAQLLKPGGFLQWFDGMALQSQVRTTNPAPKSTDACERLAAMSRQPNQNASYRWTERLDEILAANSFDVVSAGKVEFRDAYRPVWAISILAGIDDIRCKVDSDNQIALKKMMAGVADEMADGVGMESPWTCVVARKK